MTELIKDRPVLFMDTQMKLTWSTLGEICFMAGALGFKVCCHVSPVVGEYVTVEPM